MAKIRPSVKFLTFCFFLMFLGYNGVQQYVTVFFAEKGIPFVGFYSLILIYVFLSVFSPVAGAFVSRYGPKKAMVGAAAFYGVYMLSLLSGSLILVYVGSAFLGIAAAFLWNGQNVYLIKSSVENTSGRSAGLFTVAISASAAFGILLVWYLQRFLSLDTIFLMFSVLPLISFILFFFLPAVETTNVPNKFRLLKRAILSKTAMRLSLLWFGLAFISGLALGFLPLDVKDLFGVSFVGPLSVVFYVIPILFAYFSGRISDAFGRKPMIVVSFIVCSLSLIVLYFATSLSLMIMGIVLLTTYYAVTRTITYALVGDISTSENLSSLTSLFWAIQNIGTVCALLVALILAGKGVYLGSLGFVVVSLVVLYPVLRHSLPEAKEKIEKEMS